MNGPEPETTVKLSVLILVLIAGCILVPAGVGITGADTTEYDITVEEATDVPTQTVETPPEFGGTEYEVDAIAVLDPSEVLTADVSVPNTTQLNESVLQLFNSDQQLENAGIPDENGQVVFDKDDMNVSSGTYSLALADGGIQAIHPVVVSGYDLSVEHPAEASKGGTLTVEADITQTDAEEDPTVVRAIFWNETAQTQSNLTSTGDDVNGTYSGSISLADLDTGEYDVYVTVHGDKEFQGQKEILGLKEGGSVDVSETVGDTDSATGNADDDGGSDTTDSDTTDSDTTDGTTDDMSSSDDDTVENTDLTPVASDSRNIVDELPSETGLTVQFDAGAVQSVTFYEGDESGSVTVEEYDGVPPNGPDAGDRPVISGVVITPSEEHRDSQATIELAVDQADVSRADVATEDLSILKATDSGYRALETTAVESGAELLLRGETDGFSTFIVSTTDTTAPTNSTATTPASETPDGVIEPTEQTPAPETDVPDEQPGFGLVTALIAVVAAVFMLWRQEP